MTTFLNIMKSLLLKLLSHINMKKTKNSHLNILCIIKYLNKKQTLRVEKVHLVKNHSKVKEKIIKAI